MPDAMPVRPGRGGAVGPLAVGERWSGVLLAAPAVLGLAVLLLLPTGAVLVLSLTDFELGGPALRWIGFANYAELLDDPTFRIALRNTVVYVASVLPVSLCLGLGIALLIEGGVRGWMVSRDGVCAEQHADAG